MLNKFGPKLVKRLRKRAGLTQAKLATLLGVTRATVINIEKGESHLSKEQEATLLKVTNCSQKEWLEILCEEAGEEVDLGEGFRPRNGHRSSSAVLEADAALRQHGHEMPGKMSRALTNKLYSLRLARIVYERDSADLRELTRDCLATVQGGAPRRAPADADHQ